MIQHNWAIWSLAPLPFINPVCISGHSQFTYCWSLAWRLLSMTLLVNVAVLQSLSHVGFFVNPWTAACQASLSFTISRNLLKLISIELVIPSNYLILCHPLFLLPLTFPSIRVFLNELVLHIRWPKFWSFSFNISPSNEYSVLIYFRID